MHNLTKHMTTFVHTIPYHLFCQKPRASATHLRGCKEMMKDSFILNLGKISCCPSIAILFVVASAQSELLNTEGMKILLDIFRTVLVS